MMYGIGQRMEGERMRLIVWGHYYTRDELLGLWFGALFLVSLQR